MNPSHFKLFVTMIALSACSTSLQAGQPENSFRLTLETRPAGIELRVNGVAASGAFLVFESSTPEGLSDHPTVAIQTNTALTDGILFSLSTAAIPTRHAFYRAVHYTNLASIPPGTFTMGSPASEAGRASSEGPQTLVTISRGFCIGKREVTQAEYLAVMGTNPSAFSGDLSRPVETVSWNDALAYCATLTAKERAEGRLPAGYAYRLPTEAEWEYACRAETATAFHYGDALRSGMANFNGRFEYPPCAGETDYCYNPSGTYLESTTAAGSYSANAWGLHDMHGNVWEWCEDWFAGNYPGGSVTDPRGPSTGEIRVVRGGSWDDNALGCRSANRFSIYQEARSITTGFRVVLGSEPR